MMKKRIILVLLTIVLIFAIIGCGKSPNQTNNSDSEQKQTSSTTEATEPVTEESKLSDDYNVLASGTDKEGNKYELVGVEDEDYTGIKLQIGVIKNNEWLQKPTSDMPFIAQEGNIKHGTDFDSGHFSYVGYSCFYYFYSNEDYDDLDTYFCYYNAENSKYYDSDTLSKDMPRDRTKRAPDHGFLDSKMILRTTYDSEVIILDKDDMTISVLKLPLDKIENCCQVSEGLFFVSNRYYTDMKGFNTDKDRKQYICDLKGNIVMDLSKYMILYSDISDDGHGYYYYGKHFDVCFKNGQATVPLINNKLTEYTLVIDSKGNVLSTEKA